MIEVFETALATLILSTFFLISFNLLYIKNKITDPINNRSSHRTLATRSGGISFFVCLFTISFYFYFKGIQPFDFSLLIPLSLLLVVGLYDDIYNMDFKLKFIFQIIAAKIIIDNGLILENLHGVFGIYELNRMIAQLVTIFIIVAIINAVNFIDGIDCLAISIVSLFLLLFEFYIIGESPFKFLSILIVTSLIPGIYFNIRKKNKVFLGDAGSLFLGGVVSIYIIYILGNEYIITPKFDLHKILFVITIFFYPIIDIIRITIKRLLNGKSPFVADKNHIHHLILDNTNSHILTTLIILLFSVALNFIVHLVF